MPREFEPPPNVLPAPRGCTRRGGSGTAVVVLDLLTVTPILGGGTHTRDVDRVDVIRVPSVRGHLRSWWRALNAHELESPEELARSERELWGGATGDDSGGRSLVEVRVDVLDASNVDDSQLQFRNPASYALWPARRTRTEPTVPRRSPGVRFRLEVRCPLDREAEVRRALQAWVLFGGYGGRTRRGVGSLTVADPEQAKLLLPAEASREGLRACFGHDIFSGSSTTRDVPLLCGAGLWVGRGDRDGVEAWTKALGWLREFRQGEARNEGQNRTAAREKGSDRRPGRSNWPESDKVRQLSGRANKWAHQPEHNETPAWPRAGFGLPIVSRFQQKDAHGRSYGRREPKDYELRWFLGGAEHDRLASPLIVKALPLANGRFVPAALWLQRSYPEGGQVGLRENDGRSGRSRAPFDVLVARGDSARFDALEAGGSASAGQRLRTAFAHWLRNLSGVTEVAE